MTGGRGSEGIGGGFPADCVTLHSICQHCLHRIQLFTIIIVHHGFSSVWSSSDAVPLVNLGDNFWIICILFTRTVIRHGLQALSSAFLGNVQLQNTCQPGSHGQGDKTPQYPAKPCPGWQYTGKDKIQTEIEGKTRPSLYFCYICRITLHMPSNAYCQFVKQKVKT